MGQTSSYSLPDSNSHNSSAAAMSSTEPVQLYISSMSQPSRAVMLLARCLDMKYTEKEISFDASEDPDFHIKSEAYCKIHPFGTVPAIIDGDLKIVESCSILRYLASKYDTSGKWYPADLATRAHVDEFLDWHHTTLRKHGIGYFINLILYPVMNKCEADMKLVNSHKEGLQKVDGDIVSHFLKGENFIAADHVTIADLVACCELEQCAGVTFSQPIVDYMDRVKTHIGPQYDEVHGNILGFINSVLPKSE